MPTTETPAGLARTGTPRLQLAVAKCAWTRVTGAARAAGRLSRDLNNPAVEVSTALKSRFESIAQRSAVIDGHEESIEAKLAAKGEEHELRVTLQAKIMAVDWFKKEHRDRAA